MTTTTVERPFTPEMRRALLHEKKSVRVTASGGAALGRLVGVAVKLIRLLLLAVAILALGVVAVQEPADINNLLAALGFVGIVILIIRSSDTGKVRKAFEDHAAQMAARLDRDLEGGVYLETVGDVGVKASFNEHVPHKLERPDRTLDVFNPTGAIVRLGLDSPMRGVTLRYTPNAQVLFDIAAGDGRVLYRQR